MNVAVAALVLALLASSDRRRGKPVERLPENQEMIDLIRGVAIAKGVPPAIALAFADLESGFNPNAIGDRDWSQRDGGRLYRKHVLESTSLARNPARLDPSAWASYGLFQLLAPYHVHPLEHPRSLLDPRHNADRGVSFIRSLLTRTKGDPYGARLLYVGCGADGSRCDSETVAKVRARLEAALKRWEA